VFEGAEENGPLEGAIAKKTSKTYCPGEKNVGLTGIPEKWEHGGDSLAEFGVQKRSSVMKRRGQNRKIHFRRVNGFGSASQGCEKTKKIEGGGEDILERTVKKTEKNLQKLTWKKKTNTEVGTQRGPHIRTKGRGNRAEEEEGKKESRSTGEVLR